MPSTSQVQQQAAGAALAAKRGEKAASELYGASKDMYKDMSARQLGHFAGTKRKGLPHQKALVGMNTRGTTNSVGQPLAKACLNLEDAGRTIMDRLLAEDSETAGDDETAEVNAGRAILSAINRLQASLPTASPDQLHDLTTIRASANSLIRMHGQEEGPLSMNFLKSLEPPAQHGWGVNER